MKLFNAKLIVVIFLLITMLLSCSNPENADNKKEKKYKKKHEKRVLTVMEIYMAYISNIKQVMENQPLDININEVCYISLEEISYFDWFYTIEDESKIKLYDMYYFNFQPPDVCGGATTAVWKFIGMSPGTIKIKFRYCPAWDSEGPAEAVKDYYINIK